MLSQREHEFLVDLTTFRDEFRRAGGTMALRETEEHYVRSKLDGKYGSRYVLVLRNRIRKRVCAALDDLRNVAAVYADDPTAERFWPRPLLPYGFEYALMEIIREVMKQSDFQPSREVVSLMKELQTTSEELHAVRAEGNGE
ncbi:MAG TPA: hypothetical protein VEG65_05905 [Candidatus Bathyarchaeia archaeon]|nr:hypothetical protein [Candidatus Bathyarchaeia archaeon]